MTPPCRITVTRMDLSQKEIAYRYIKEKDIPYRERIHSISLIMRGYIIEEVAEIMEVTQKTVRWWISLYNQGGLEELSPKKNLDVLLSSPQPSNNG